MAVILSTSFEDYDVNGTPNENLSLVEHGWTTGSDIGVVASGAHTGSKSVLGFGHAMQWPGYYGRSISVVAWFNIDSAGEPIVSGPNIQIYGSGPLNPLQIFCENGTNDLVLYVADVEVGRAEDVIVLDVYQKLRVDAKFSTVNDAGDDVNADGCVTCYLDNVLVITVTGHKVWVKSEGWASGDNEYEGVFFQAIGNIDDILISNDELTCGGLTPGDPPPNDSTPCCGSGPNPTDPDPSSTPNPGDVPIPLQPWTPQCDGGGAVPFAMDVADQEFWEL